jgi:hypothetical protein
MEKEKEKSENHYDYIYFDETNKICLYHVGISETVEDFLSSVIESFIYIINKNSFAVKTFRNGNMEIKIMKSLPIFFNMDKLDVEENGKIKKKTKKEIFQDNFYKIKKCNDMVFQPYASDKKPKSLEKNLNLYTGPPGYISESINVLKKKSKINYEIIDPILKHISILTNHKKKHTDYLINWLANIIQCPERKNGVCIIIKSDQGAGKSSFFNWFGKYIVGKQWFLPVTDARILTENKFNYEMQNKLFTMLDEAQTNGRYVAGNERMKTIITEDSIRIEMKGQEAYHIEDKNNFILLTNNDFPVKIDYSDRRYCCFSASNELIRNENYFKKYFKDLENKEIMKEFYKYLLYEVDLTDFSCENIPESDLKTDIRIDSSPSPIKYAINLLQNGFKKEYENDSFGILDNVLNSDNDESYIDSQKLYMNYKQYCINKCPNDKIYAYSGFNKKFKELLNINSEKTKTLGEITFINKNTLTAGLKSYFNVEDVNRIFNTNLIYDEGYTST